MIDIIQIHQTAKVFNDILGFRTLCDNYEDVMKLQACKNIRVADMSGGKAENDGYRGVHIYFQLSSFHYPIEIQYNTYYDRQLSSFHYPIEIQYNTYYDRQFNNWLHKYVYKREYDNQIGCILRQLYENAKIRNENEFKEMLNYVLSDSEKI